jgi:hypothetical protein
MEAGKIFAGALAAAISIQLDVMEQPFRRPIFLRLAEHARERERSFIKGPAIQPGEIYRGRFDPVIDLEGERFVTSADQRASDGSGPFADRERLPISFPGAVHEPIETVATFKDGAEGQARFRLRELERGAKEKNNHQSPEHGREYKVQSHFRFVFFVSAGFVSN